MMEETNAHVSRTTLAPLTPTPLGWVLRPLTRFIATQVSGAVVLFGATVAALVWANVDMEGYAGFWHTPLAVSAGEWGFSLSLEGWVNDGLMAIFFLVVGMEIKREFATGELSDRRAAALPIVGAVGGMLVPALCYAVLNAGLPSARGWAIPMATDIAFALGAVALLGKRVPVAAKLFLMALAIVDDLGAVLVIALFYTEGVQWQWLAVAAMALGAIAGLGRLGLRSLLAFVLLGVVAWLGVLQSGIHATVAGVLVALALPTRTRMGLGAFVGRTGARLEALAALAKGDLQPETPRIEGEEQALIHEIEGDCERLLSPSQRLERGLHPWVSFLVVPLFALANAGIVLEGGAAGLLGALGQPMSLGILAGLVLGKPVGIVLASLLAIRLGWGKLGQGFGRGHLVGMALLAGIGFTMSIFIAMLAFGNEAGMLGTAKAAIMLASACAGAAGLAFLRWGVRKEQVQG